MTTLKQKAMSSYDVLIDGAKVGHVKILPRCCGGGWLWKLTGGPSGTTRTRREAIEHVEVLAPSKSRSNEHE